MAQIVEDLKDAYVFTEDMKEISGFGGSYEQACRLMIINGLYWLKENPDKSLDEIEDAITKDIPDGATNLMISAVKNHITFVVQNGWDEYKKLMTKKE